MTLTFQTNIPCKHTVNKLVATGYHGSVLGTMPFRCKKKNTDQGVGNILKEKKISKIKVTN